jgi:Alpha and gamma adaptin binding protein p34
VRRFDFMEHCFNALLKLHVFQFCFFEDLVSLALNEGCKIQEQSDKSLIPFDRTQLTLDTKYYTAPIQIVELPCDTYSKISTEAPFETLLDVAGIVFVVNLHDPIDYVENWSFLGAFEEELDRSTLICFTHAFDGKSENKSEEEIDEDDLRAKQEKLQEWCFTNRVELVSGRDSTESTEHEKQGVPRVLEALYTTDWSSMTRKEIAKKSETASSTATISAVAPTNSTSKEAEDKGDINAEATLNSLAETAEEPEDETDTESALGRLMQQMQQVRENAKKALASGNMTDSERRAIAAEMAMKMMAMFGADMGDEDEDEEGEALGMD